MSLRRIVAVVAFVRAAAWVRVTAARVRLKAITAQTSQAALALNTPEGRWGQGGGLEVGVDVFDDRVPPVGLVRGDGVAGVGVGGGEEGVEAPGVEQRLLAVALLRVQLRDAAHDQPAGDLLGLLLRDEGGERDLGD